MRPGERPSSRSDPECLFRTVQCKKGKRLACVRWSARWPTTAQARCAHTHTKHTTRTGINRIATPYKGGRLACRNDWPQIILLILVVAGTKGNAAGQCRSRHAVGVATEEAQRQRMILPSPRKGQVNGHSHSPQQSKCARDSF